MLNFSDKACLAHHSISDTALFNHSISVSPSLSGLKFPPNSFIKPFESLSCFSRSINACLSSALRSGSDSQKNRLKHRMKINSHPSNPDENSIRKNETAVLYP